jgi:hypothetical protein
MDMPTQQLMKHARENMRIESAIEYSKAKFLKDYIYAIIVTIQNVLIPIIYGQELQKKICKMLKERVG